MAAKAAVLLARDGPTSRILYQGMRRDCPIATAILEPAPPRVQFLRRRAARIGPRRVLGQVLFRLLLVPLLRRLGRDRIREILTDHALSDDPITEPHVVRVASANSIEVIGLLRRLDPAVVLVNGTRILTPEVLDSIPAPFFNIHAGITPLYRGVHGAYWALVNADGAHCGVTVHALDEGIDTGPILGQATIAPAPGDNITTYPILQAAAALPILRRACQEVMSGAAPRQVERPVGASRLWTHPTLLEYLQHRRRLGVH